MTHRLVIAALAAYVLATPAAGQPACPMTYPAFELAVPHLDLETCPTELKRADAFCRASTGHDAVHVFVFSQMGEQCLLAVKSYEHGQYQLTVK